MKLVRRDFMKGVGTLVLSTGIARTSKAQAAFSPQPGAWRTFEVEHVLTIDRGQAPAQAWIPIPAVNEAGWFRTIKNQWSTNGEASKVRDDSSGASMIHARWPAGSGAASIRVVSRVETRDRSVDFRDVRRSASLTAAERTRYTNPTKLIPISGIVKETSDKIIADARADSDYSKAKAIYEWIVENTYRDAKVRGCGVGDIASMLKSGALSGKCADLNALFVGLARAQGIPARDLYGVRVAPSKFGYRSLGAGNEIVSKAQHCRAEIYLTGHGWVAVDPADVRKVVLEESPGNLAIDDEKVRVVRSALFGSWEGNWLAYNFAHDVSLPASAHGQVGFLMYPQAETIAGRLDCLDPETFKYSITAKEISA